MAPQNRSQNFLRRSRELISDSLIAPPGSLRGVLTLGLIKQSLEKLRSYLDIAPASEVAPIRDLRQQYLMCILACLSDTRLPSDGDDMRVINVDRDTALNALAEIPDLKEALISDGEKYTGGASSFDWANSCSP